YHLPVLREEVIAGLAIRPDGIYVDATFGGGGHSRAILEKLEKGRLIVFDQDESAWQNRIADERVVFVPQNFRHLLRFLKLHQAPVIDGLLADLGVSSYQFDTAERGFSTRFEGNLDMRMDRRNELTAARVLQSYPETRLHKLFEQYGEVSNARTLAGTIVQVRKLYPMNTIETFRAAIQPIIKGNPNRYLAQVFQALRMEVNDELNALKELLEQAKEALRPGGRLAVITFHSIEDRIVKNFMKTGYAEPYDIPSLTYETPAKPFRQITKKPLTAGPEELRQNPRARSAKLRVAEKV
ncbi:MAG TPA: 16S rRNA (cytosine(1402)-N(4))-methyltransferase RsmH, partial [Chitinophagaceae bacterium]